ncbi:hypothetical protein XELAEV_18036143mg [Xenopus laevis]|uniref:GIY-YIG domain-containing protein n=1 Tax=Xenopus laevis TaxID=8355 RepID=A0A974CH22_XENLA|nr:hypothetical protein XELAEV_18036143mg [Xenopus laevis]
MRVKRIVSPDEVAEVRLTEMCDKFQARGYPEGLLHRQSNELRTKERAMLLEKKEKKTGEHVIFVTQYNVLSKHFSKILKGHWALIKDNLLHIKAFERPPMIAYKKGTPIRIIKCPCGLAYVGQTSRTIRERIREHKSAIKAGKKEQAIAGHFIEAGHNVNQLRFQVIEVVSPKHRGGNRIKTLLYREAFWIRRLETLIPLGLNKEYDLKPIFR